MEKAISSLSNSDNQIEAQVNELRHGEIPQIRSFGHSAIGGVAIEDSTRVHQLKMLKNRTLWFGASILVVAFGIAGYQLVKFAGGIAQAISALVILAICCVSLYGLVHAGFFAKAKKKGQRHNRG
jgi:hypothetical protein